MKENVGKIRCENVFDSPVETDEYTIGMEKNGNYSHISENLEDEVSSSEVDLSSFKKRFDLNNKIWDDTDTLNSMVRMRLLDIADDFWEFVNLTWVKPKNIILTGSICNYNWSEFSDIDLHLIVDFAEVDEKTEFVRDYLDSKKNDWNTTHSGLKIYDFPIEVYVQDVNDGLNASGVYDLEENKWIEKPNSESICDIESEEDKIKNRAANIMTIIDNMSSMLDNTNDSHKIEEIGNDVQALWAKVKAMRKKSLESDGESGIGNIVYKTLRRYSYLDKLWNLKNVCYDRMNSIMESKELIKEYLDKDYMFPLYKLLNMTDKEKVLKITSENPRLFEGFVEKKLDNFYYKKMGIDADHFKQLDREKAIDLLDRCGLCKTFIDELISTYCDMLECLPPYITMKFKRFFKNQWCIHFTTDAEKVAKEGFKRGHSSINTVSYTRRNIYGDKPKDDEGYNYCFLLDDEDMRNDIDCRHFGLKEAVIFIANGVEVYHHGDHQTQAIFLGSSVKEIIPIKSINNYWYIMGKNGKIFRYAYESPSKVAQWVTNNYQQYRRQISYERHNTEEGIGRYKNAIMLLKEEIVADGNSEHNPYAKRWKAERQALKDFICNYGKIMTSRENGKQYKVYFDKTLSDLVGYNYCICLQWDPVMLKPSSTLYIRALDKFTNRIFQAQYDSRGFDNEIGTRDDVTSQQMYRM